MAGTSTGTYTTTATGYYEFTNLGYGNYVVTPFKQNYSFSPLNKNYTPLSSSQDDQNFSVTYSSVVYSIQGYVFISLNVGLSGVSVNLSGSNYGIYTTTSSGYYEFSNLIPGNYAVIPSKTEYSFYPASTSFTSLNSNQSNKNFTATYKPTTYAIKGYIKTLSGTGVAKTNVLLSGTTNAVYSTSLTGYYEFNNLTSGNYTVTPSSRSWAFDPVNRSYSTLNSTMTDQNFSATPYGFIAGKVTSTVTGLPVKGAVVEVIKSSAVVYSTVSDSNGNYYINIATGVYDITVSSDIYVSVTKNNILVVYNTTNTLNFSLQQKSIYITGYIKDTTNVGIASVTVSLSGTVSRIYITTSSGYYTFFNLSPGNYNITPTKQNYWFSPMNRNNAALTNSLDNQNFTGNYSPVVYSIKGYVKTNAGAGINGVVLTLTGELSGSYTTNSSGYYEFVNLIPGNYTVSPFKQNYTFSPTNISFYPIDANQTNQNFVGSYAPILYSIKGYVKQKAGDYISGVVLTLTGDNTGKYVTSNTGYYEFINLSPGNYNVSPNTEGYSYIFLPSTRTFSLLNTNATGQNFVDISSESPWGSNPVKIMNPKNNDQLNGSIEISANVNEALEIAKVEFYINNMLYIVHISTPFTYLWDTTKFSDASYTIEVKAYDSTERVFTDKIEVAVINNPVEEIELDDGVIEVKNNLVNSTTKMSMFYNPKTEAVKIDIFDVSGRKIKAVYDNKTDSTINFTWDGKDENSVPVPNGLYIVFIKDGGDKLVKKVLVVR